MRKVEGHVLQPLLPWVRQQVTIPDHWDGKSRCSPALNMQMCNISQKLQNCNERIAKRACRQKGQGQDKLCKTASTYINVDTLVSVNESKCLEAWQQYTQCGSAVVSETQLLPLKERLREFVKCPIDKLNTDGAIV